MWFCFDGCDFHTFDSEEKAAKCADEAMAEFSDEAAGDGWSEQACQVCWGKVTHAVRVETRDLTDEERQLHRDWSHIEHHYLEPVEE